MENFISVVCTLIKAKSSKLVMSYSKVISNVEVWVKSHKLKVKIRT